MTLQSPHQLANGLDTLRSHRYLIVSVVYFFEETLIDAGKAVPLFQNTLEIRIFGKHV